MKLRILIVTASISLFFLAIPQTAPAQKNGEAQFVILDNSYNPTIGFSHNKADKQGCAFLVSKTLMDHEEALALRVAHVHERTFIGRLSLQESGWLYITTSRIIFNVEGGDKSHAFELPRTALDDNPAVIEDDRFAGLRIRLKERLQPSNSKEQKFNVYISGEKKCDVESRPYMIFVVRAVNDFKAAVAEFDQLTASLKQSSRMKFTIKPIAPIGKSSNPSAASAGAGESNKNEPQDSFDPPNPYNSVELKPPFSSGLGEGRGGGIRPATPEEMLKLFENPKDAKEFYAKAFAYYELRNYDMAIVNFDKALELDPQQASGYLGRGLVFSLKKDYDRAIADLDRAIQLKPMTDAYFLRGEAFLAKGEYDRAIADYDKVLELDPQRVGVYLQRAGAHYQKGDYDRVVSDVDKIIQQNPTATAYSLRALTYSTKGDYNQAIADYSKAIQLDPKEKDVLFFRGDAHYRVGDYERAITDFDSAIELNPNDSNSYKSRGMAYSHKGNHDRAIADFDRAIQLSPQDAEAYMSRGIAYARKNDIDRAFLDFDKAVQLSPANDVAYYNRGRAYFFKSDHQRAIADFDKAIQLNPNHRNAYHDRGFTYASKGDYPRAIADYSEAIRLKPDSRAYQNRAAAYERSGNKEKAKADMDKVAELEKQIGKP